MNWKFWKILKSEKSIMIGEAKGSYFPCASDNCLVRVACTKPCEKIEMDEDKLMNLFMEYNACPDCGSTKFMEGPSGGMSTNVKCAGCGHWFNMSLPVCIERIHMTDGRFYD
jgi:hypothetical protein